MKRVINVWLNGRRLRRNQKQQRIVYIVSDEPTCAWVRQLPRQATNLGGSHRGRTSSWSCGEVALLPFTAGAVATSCVCCYRFVAQSNVVCWIGRSRCVNQNAGDRSPRGHSARSAKARRSNLHARKIGEKVGLPFSRAILNPARCRLRPPLDAGSTGRRSVPRTDRPMTNSDTEEHTKASQVR